MTARDPDKPTFLSPRNVPLWVGVFLAGVMAVLVWVRNAA